MIINIALGIVLAVLILRFLPLLIGLGAVLIVIALFLLVGGAYFYWAGSSLVGFAVIAIVAGGISLAVRITKNAPIRKLRARIDRRQAAGYDTADLETELTKALSESDSTVKARRDLGYTDDK